MLTNNVFFLKVSVHYTISPDFNAARMAWAAGVGQARGEAAEAVHREGAAHVREGAEAQSAAQLHQVQHRDRAPEAAHVTQCQRAERLAEQRPVALADSQPDAGGAVYARARVRRMHCAARDADSAR